MLRLYLVNRQRRKAGVDILLTKNDFFKKEKNTDERKTRKKT